MKTSRIKYDILSATDRKSLVEIIERFNEENGWMPQGSPFCDEWNGMFWHQAVIREKRIDEE